MAPNMTSAPTGVLHEDEHEILPEIQSSNSKTTQPQQKQFKLQLVWLNITLFALLHLSCIYSLYLVFTSAKLATTIFSILLYLYGGLGITAGAHRLWAHRAYKAKWPLKLFLVIGNSVAFQNSVYEWSRDHRVHHKFSETDADPHNARRGFFFSHIGWLLCKKHPDVKEKGKGLDMSDLKNDPLLHFQHKYYLAVMPIFFLLLPTAIPMYCWGESFKNSIYVATFLRYCINLNATWLVNSAAHMWGDKPYDRYINPAENRFVALFALGEGWHNYHHTFPWDYKTAELGGYELNFTTMFIDAMAKLGLAYDLKTVDKDVVKRRVCRTGDGTHELWGWGDKDATPDQTAGTVTLNTRDMTE